MKEPNKSIGRLYLRNVKIPVIELSFIKDQRAKVGLNGGRMIMNGNDKVVAKQQESTKRKSDKVMLQTKRYIEEKNKKSNADEIAKKEIIQELSDAMIDNNIEDISFIPSSDLNQNDVTVTTTD